MAYHESLAENKNYYVFQRRSADAYPHFHSATEMILVERGEVSVTVDGQKRVLKRGDGAFVAGFQVHSYTPANEENLCYVLLCPQAFASRLSASFGNKNPPTFFKFDSFSTMQVLLEACNLENSDEFLRLKAFEGCLQILYACIAANQPFVESHDDGQQSLVCEILKFANENLSSTLSLEVLSKRFGYARESLSRLLHKHLSESWNSYVNRLRVRLADSLLKEENRTVLDVAYACGFNSPNTFYRAYLKEFGTPPRLKSC